MKAGRHPQEAARDLNLDRYAGRCIVSHHMLGQSAKGPSSPTGGLGALIMDAAIKKIGGELTSGPIEYGY